MRHLVELHGGTIEAKSARLGHGATFTVRLPMSRVEGVDAIATVLELCGAEVDAVSSVADALASIAQSKPDAIVSDIAMPAEYGFALIRELRDKVEGGSGVRALALTAYASANDQRRILAAGVDAYMTKPIDATELVETVARLARS